MQDWRRYLLWLTFLTGAYFLTAHFGLQWATVPGAVSPVFPAAGVALAGLLLGGVRLWPAVLIGRLLAFWAADVEQGYPLWLELVVAGGNTLAAVVGAYGLKRWGRIDLALTRLRDVLWFALWGAVVSNIFAASIGMLSIGLYHGMDLQSIALGWSNWWAGNIASTLIVAPLILVWIKGEPVGRWHRWLHLIICIASICLMSWFVFISQYSPLRTWYLFPLLIWAALAFHVRGAATAMLVAGIFAIWGTTEGKGPLVWMPIHPTLHFLFLQQFLAIAAATAYVLAAVADEHRGKEALRQHQELLHTITDNADSALVMLDIEGRITFLNPAFTRITGYSELEARGKIAHDLIHYRHRDGRPFPVEQCPIERSYRDLQPVRNVEVNFIRKDGSHLPAIASVAPLQRGSRPIGGVLEFRDVTWEKQVELEREQLLESERMARSEAERANRLKDDFLATLSHELRTPLNAISGWAQLLLQPGRDEADLEEGLRTIARNAKLQTQLIHDLLDLSRITSGKLRLELEPVDLGDIVESSVKAIMPSAMAKNLRVEKIVGAVDGPVIGDAARLQQVLWNLLTNAVKFTPPGGKIQVLLQRFNSHVEISVSDTGEGIPPEFLPFMFERFRQADGSSTRRHGGLGIGLALVKQLVEMHGGRIGVQSPGTGRGAAFTITLPLSLAQKYGEKPRDDRQESGARDKFDPAAAPDLSGVRVLVVDDDPDSREIARRLLENRRAVVLTACDAQQGLELLETQSPDVLLSDIGMPNLDGYQFIQRVRSMKDSESADVQAAALTAFARHDDRRRALMAGFQSHISKPIDPVEFYTVVSTLAGRARSQAL